MYLLNICNVSQGLKKMFWEGAKHAIYQHWYGCKIAYKTKYNR